MTTYASQLETFFENRAQSENDSPGMHLELIRLSSFKNWPRWAPVGPNRLAKAGFFYTGQGDETECFHCHGKVKKWHEGDRPADRHYRLYPQCSFVKDEQTLNVPLPQPADSPDRPMNYSVPVGSAQSGTLLASDSSAENSASQIPRSILLPDYQQENARLETFGNFPISAYVGPEELAQAGFVYLGSQDRVQCAFCKGVLKNWAPGDRAFTEHQKHFPHCPFIRNPSAARLSQRGARNTSIPTQSEHSARPQNSYNQNLPNPLAELGIETDLAKHHAFAQESTRLASFTNWPKEMKQQPAELARAGFFYIGQADSVKCYWCDGGLRNWDATDDPWVEHARWFPRCGHVKRIKGVRFIETVQKTRNHESQPGGVVLKNIDPGQVTARLHAPDVKRVLEMGFDQQFVKHVIEYRLRTSVDDFPNFEELLEICLKYSVSPPSNFPLVEIEQQSQPAAAAERSQPAAAEANESPKSASPKPEKKAQDASGNSVECKVCMDADVNIVFLPCGHLVCCSNCAPALKNCPICRGLIRGTVNAILS